MTTEVSNQIVHGADDDEDIDKMEENLAMFIEARALSKYLDEQMTAGHCQVFVGRLYANGEYDYTNSLFIKNANSTLAEVVAELEREDREHVLRKPDSNYVVTGYYGIKLRNFADDSSRSFDVADPSCRYLGAEVPKGARMMPLVGASAVVGTNS